MAKRKNKKERADERERIRLAFSKSWSSGGGGTPCGLGSTIESTEAIRLALPALLYKYGIKSINDAGCGDFHWIQKLKLHFKRFGIDYLGYDVVDRKRKVMPFQELEITSEKMRKADLIICRDVLFHLTNDLIFAALAQFRKSKSRYLLATTSPGDNSLRVGDKIGVGAFQRVGLQSEPFNLGEPLEKIEEPKFRRFLGLWEL